METILSNESLSAEFPDNRVIDLQSLNAHNASSAQAVSGVLSSDPPKEVPQWKKARAVPMKMLWFLFFAVLGFFAWECITTKLKWPEQAVIAAAMMAAAWFIDRFFQSPSTTLALMLFSCIATARYAYWRVSGVAAAFRDHDPSTEWKNVFFLLLLLLAEAYAFLTLFLGYFQTIWPLHRPPAQLPDDHETWPAVDVFIPTYNEDLSVMRPTVIAALHIAYPKDRLNVYVLDDGDREEFKQFCAEVGAGYITRFDHSHAKAGNLNHALTQTSSPLVAIFDTDHIPTMSFLQVTVGWFLRDAKLGLLQTPHYFYSPDPFDRNLGQFLVVPNEAELFYGFVQDGNDFWNAAFFCGSCAILRRTAITEMGGIATQTVTEDAHTALLMQAKGWNTAYINIPQAAGLGTETLARHVGQRIRWARGMAQIARINFPMMTKGLDWAQRICYTNALLHFFFGIPRLIFATAPLVYLLLGRINIPGDWVAIIAYAMPHLYLIRVANHRTHAAYRHPGWSSIYELSIAPYIALPTLLALVSRKTVAFNVTDKGGIIEQTYFDRQTSKPHLVLLFLYLIALAMVPIRLLFLNAAHPGAVTMNAIWTVVELGYLGVVLRVASEQRQVRETSRIRLSLPAALTLAGADPVSAETHDVSMGGSKLKLAAPIDVAPGMEIQVTYIWNDVTLTLRAQVVEARGNFLRLRHLDPTADEQQILTLILFAAPERWMEQELRIPPKEGILGFLRLTQNSILGIASALGSFLPRKSKAISKAAAAIALLVATAAMSGQVRRAATAPAPEPAPAPAGSSSTPTPLHTTITFRDLGLPEAIVFRGIEASREVPFNLPQTQIAQRGSLDLRYSFSPSLIAAMSHINVLLNHELLATLTMANTPGSLDSASHAVITLPPEMLVRNNILTFEFVGHYTMQCEDPSNTALWARIESSSQVDVTSLPVSLNNDLSTLPLPFYDGAVSSTSAAINVFFPSRPSDHALEAAGILASRLGVLAQTRPLNFPVSIGGNLPAGNVAVLYERWSDVPPELNIPTNGPTVALRTNPRDPYGKLLIIAGGTGEQLVTAARGLALARGLAQGATFAVTNLEMPSPRDADDAPTWLPAGRVARIVNNSSDAVLQTDGSGPIAVYMQLPPDLYYASREQLALHLDYRYNSLSLSDHSTMRLDSNGMMVGQIGLPHESKPRNSTSYDFELPLSTLRPFSNTLLFNFYFQLPKTGACSDQPPIDLKGAVLRSSSLDLRGLYHWAALPDLGLFGNAGFPFTRFADLAQTRIILPPQRSAAEVSLYLVLMAYFGEQTGFPALRVEVGGPSALGEDKDYLILGNPTDQPAFNQVSDLPVIVRTDGFDLKETRGLFSLIERNWWRISEVRPDWWWRVGNARERSGLLATLSEPPEAVLQAEKSPWGASRSIVAITVRDDDAVKPFVEAFWKARYSGDVSQSVSVLHDQEFQSYRLGERYYFVGQLPFWLLVRFWLTQYPWLIVLISLAIALLLLPILRGALQLRARQRLGVE